MTKFGRALLTAQGCSLDGTLQANNPLVKLINSLIPKMSADKIAKTINNHPELCSDATLLIENSKYQSVFSYKLENLHSLDQNIERNLAGLEVIEKELRKPKNHPAYVEQLVEQFEQYMSELKELNKQSENILGALTNEPKTMNMEIFEKPRLKRYPSERLEVFEKPQLLRYPNDQRLQQHTRTHTMEQEQPVRARKPRSAGWIEQFQLKQVPTREEEFIQKRDYLLNQKTEGLEEAYLKFFKLAEEFPDFIPETSFNLHLNLDYPDNEIIKLLKSKKEKYLRDQLKKIIDKSYNYN